MSEAGERSAAYELAHPRKWVPQVRARDFEQALADPSEMARQAPTCPKPRLMLERLRIVGDDKLTAADHALYELLLAVARHKGLTETSYAMPAKVAQDYLGMARWTDLKKSIKRLSTTRVAFAYRSEVFREAGEVAMVNVHYREGLGAHRGQNEIRWEFPSILRTVLLAARMYDYVELAAFPRFRSKYAGRLYGLAASHSKRGGWSMSPEQLAEALGWTAPNFHYGSFLQRCLEPAMVDIDAHVERLNVAYSESRSTGRGKRVEKLTFLVETAAPRLEETKTLRMGKQTLAEILGRDILHPAHLLPSARLIARGCRLANPSLWGRVATAEDLRARLRPRMVSFAWRAALDEARYGLDPDGGHRVEPWHLRGDDLLDAIDRDGLEAAFLRWLKGEARSPYHRNGQFAALTLRNAAMERRLNRGEIAASHRGALRAAIAATIVIPELPTRATAVAAGPVSYDNEEGSHPSWEIDIERDVEMPDEPLECDEVDDGDIPY